MPTLSTRRSDLAQLRGRGNTHDASAFVGEWLPTERSTSSLVRIVMSEREGALRIHVWGAGLKPEDPPIDWGEQTAALFETAPGDPQSGGVLTTYVQDHAEITIAGNCKRGTLVLASYAHFKDQSQRRDYYTRQFFHRVDDSASVEVGRDTSLFGSWRNTHFGTTGIISCTVTATEAGGRLSLRGAEAGPLAGSHEDIPLTVCGEAFVADAEIGDGSFRLACNLNRGLLIIALFATGPDMAGLFKREFFYRL